MFCLLLKAWLSSSGHASIQDHTSHLILFKALLIVTATASLIAYHYFDEFYVGIKPMVYEVCCAKDLLKKKLGET